MPIIRLPKTYESTHTPARGPVLLLTCMDLRFLDETIQFMDNDGLANRYDHVIMAGAALGALGGGGRETHQHWRETFFDHLRLAYDLHHIKDVYIMEHRDCGAYGLFLGDEGTFDEEEQEREAAVHCLYAERLQEEIKVWAAEHHIKLHVKSFLMDLRGHVSLLSKTPERTTAKKKKLT